MIARTTVGHENILTRTAVDQEICLNIPVVRLAKYQIKRKATSTAITSSSYRVFIKNCVFSKILKYIPDFGLSRFPLGVSVCIQWQVKHQRCSGTGRVKKYHNISRKKTQYLMNTL